MLFTALFAKIRAKYVAWQNSRRPAVQVTVVMPTTAVPEEMDMTPEQFLKMFPPRPGHSTCNGKGYYIQVVPALKGINTVQGEAYRKIAFCNCVQNQYKRSGMKINLKEEMNGTRSESKSR